VASDSAAVATFRLVLEEYLALGDLRETIALQTEAALANGPIERYWSGTAPRIGAEAGNRRCFAHYRQPLKFCGRTSILRLSILDQVGDHAPPSPNVGVGQEPRMARA
jgi:hypothetical protein